MLLENLDARIYRAHQRLRAARRQGHPAVIADCERWIDHLLDRRLEIQRSSPPKERPCLTPPSPS